MSKQVDVEFTFHNVGQGLFYSGKINDFNFIYDCGSEKKAHLEKVVKEYLNNKLSNSDIDLLVISHLHADHIAGLKYIFDAGVHVRTVLLPYFSPIERLRLSIEKTNHSDWLYEFWSDPIDYLSKKETTVVLMGHGEGAENQAPNRDRLFDDRFNIDELPDDDSLKKEIIKKDESHSTSWKKVHYKNHKGQITLSRFWLFKFFNHKIEDIEKRDSFERYVRRKIGDLDLVTLIADKEKIRGLKNRYEALGGDFNDTSLVMYHAPVTKSIVKGFSHYSDPHYISGKIEYPNKITLNLPQKTVGHLLTGDINLNCWNELQQHINENLSNLEAALVPHHGAGGNWNRNAFDGISNSCSWIISSGIVNKYGHPSLDVCQQIANNGNYPVSANEGTEVSIKDSLLLK